LSELEAEKQKTAEKYRTLRTLALVLLRILEQSANMKTKLIARDDSKKASMASGSGTAREVYQLSVDELRSTMDAYMYELGRRIRNA
jgi:hypothetical protein